MVLREDVSTFNARQDKLQLNLNIKSKHSYIVFITMQTLHHDLHELNVFVMSTLYFIAKIVSTHYLI